MFKKIRFYYLFFTTYIRKNLRSVLRFGVFALFVLVFFAITFTNFWSPLFNKATSNLTRTSYTEGLVGSVKSLNPLFETTEAEKEINQLIFRGLTKIGTDGKVEADLAESYSLISSTEYLFKIKKNIFWQDGEPFRADDVVYTIREAQNPNLATTARTAFKDVGVEKVDDFTVKFILKEPFAPFLTQTTLGILPKHISLKSYRPVGTSSFHLVSFSPEKIVLGDSKHDLIFKFYPSQEKALLALKQGEIKALGGLTRESSQEFKAWHNIKIYSETLPNRVVTIFFNTRADFVVDKSVRQALALDTPKQALLKYAEFGSQLASGPFSNFNYLNIDQKERFSFDESKAISLLNATGWKKTGEKLSKGGKDLSLTLTIPKDPEFEKIADQIGRNWKKLGVDFQIIKLDNETLKEVIKRTQFQAVLTTEEISSDPDQYVLWHSTQITQGNITLISSPKLDKLLEDARKSNDSVFRKDKYTEFARILSDESPAIFLYYPGYTWVVNSRVGNIKLNYFQNPADRFQNASDWQIPKLVI